MELQLELICPECNASWFLNFIDLSPGQLRHCSNCQAPLRLTMESLERFDRDVRDYCEN